MATNPPRPAAEHAADAPQRDLTARGASAGASATSTHGLRERWLAVPGWVRWLLGPLLLSLFLMARQFEPLLELPYAFGTREFGGSVGDRITSWVDRGTTALATPLGIVDNTLEAAITWIDGMLHAIPWPALVIFVAILAWRAVGPKMGIFALVALSLTVLVGLWDAALNTFTLVFVAVAISVSIAIPLGILNAESRRIDALTRPILDTMQTMPSMVYLVPALVVFGLGNVAGVIATAVFAIPPTVKYTTVGLYGVPASTTEAAESFGASRWETLWEVKLPIALPSIMAGVSQSTMNALGLVIIAAIVGARGLGEVVEQSLTRLETGQGIMAGFAIVLIAVLIDRITEGIANRRSRELGVERSVLVQ